MFYAYPAISAPPLCRRWLIFGWATGLGVVLVVLGFGLGSGACAEAPSPPAPFAEAGRGETAQARPMDDEPLAPPEFPGDTEHRGSGPPRPTPEDSAAAFVFDDSLGLASQFAVKVFAAEPDVRNPIGMAWDRRGRMWIAENYSYGKMGEKLRTDQSDRVVVLEDNDLDGHHDRRTVFIDTLSQLTSVEVGRGGVWLMTPPRLLFIPDANEDLVPDGPARVVLDGFTVAKQNGHNFANGLRFGPGGWLYGRCGGSCPGRVGPPGTADEDRTALEGGIWRYNLDTGTFEVICHGTTNPWGHDFTADGELVFINTVNGHLWHGIEGAHFKRPFTLDPNPSVMSLIDQHADHYHFDTTGAWTDSRDGAANHFGGGHAHCGTMIYQETTWPESLRGSLLTLNFHGRRANRERLAREGSGIVAKHQPDFFISADPWFRGMEISAGPDGNVFVLDWSDLGECHEHTGVHRTSGRIYKIEYVPASDEQNRQATRRSLEQLASDDPSERIKLQDHPARWFRDQAKLTSLGVGDLAKDPALEGSLARSTTEDADLVKTLRGLTDHWPIDDCYGPNATSRAAWPLIANDVARLKPELIELATTTPHASVRRQLASMLQRLPIEDRADLAVALVQRAEDVGDHNNEKLIWYGVMSLADNHADDLLRVAAASELPETSGLVARALSERVDEHPHVMDALLVIVADRFALDLDESSIAMLRGIDAGLTGIAKLPTPTRWADVESRLSPLIDASDPLAAVLDRLRTTFGRGRSPEELLRVAKDAGQTPESRLSALRGLIDAVNTLPDRVDLHLGTIQVVGELLRDARINADVAAVAVQFPRPIVGEMIAKSYNKFRAPHRPAVIALLCSREVFAWELLASIEAKRIDASELSASHVRVLMSLGEPEITRRIETLWGKLRESPAERLTEIARLHAMLTPEKLAAADLVAGRGLFEKNCAACHQLYGQGGKVGPDLTGAQRDNLDYWLHNIVDPDAVVSADFRATQVLTEDGRLLVGLVTQRTRRTITLVSADQTWTLADEEIADSRMIDQSPMPSGVLQPLDDNAIANLIAYLKHPTQVAN